MALTAAALTAGGAVAADEKLTARGNEPSWRLDISADALAFEAPGLGLSFEAPVTARDTKDGRSRIVAQARGETLEMFVTERPCADLMTGMPFPVGVEVSYSGRSFTGCGGDIMTAIEGGWRVIRLGSEPLPQGVTATVVFDREGRASGRSGCNRFTGAYTLSGEGLSFGQIAGTRMACPPAEMETERRFLDLLQKVTRATPGENGQLRLMAGDEQAMVLDRAD
jgi:heat shock protein HslJ/uncharacterized membrane protein